MSNPSNAPRESIPAIVLNDEYLYEGNLAHYFQVVFRHARNLDNPYHNFRHLFHMLWLAYNACKFYAHILTKRQMRNLLIASLFHDFDHSGKAGNDDLNIEIAIRGLQKHIAPEDAIYFDDICKIIRPTQYPYVVSADTLDLSAQIMRDADVSQVFSTAWIQQVIFGLAKEWGMDPIKVLEMQEPFLSKVVFTTDWAKGLFGPKVVKDKVAEAHALVAILNGEAV